MGKPYRYTVKKKRKKAYNKRRKDRLNEAIQALKKQKQH